MNTPVKSTIDYKAAMEEISAKKNLPAGMKLLDALSDYWYKDYKQQVGRKTEVTDMFSNGFTYMFDLEGSDHCDGRGPQPPGVFPRVVAAYGLSNPPDTDRSSDDKRMRGIMGSTKAAFGENRDKGHFIGFSLGGEIIASETNMFSQRRDLNRGWSEEGKVFRRMERFAAAAPGSMFFHRPIYEHESLTPAWLEVGVIRADLSVWSEVFDNRT